MPFENVYGNGGLLTTVGDLLKWNENFVTPVVGDAAFVAEEQTAGHVQRRHARTATGSACSSARYRGLREVYHSGSTAGYQAFLTRFPGPACLGGRPLQRQQRPGAAVRARGGGLYLADRLKPATG